MDDPLWAALINSDWHDHLGSGRTEDRIGNDEWLARFLCGTVWRRDGLPSPAERRRLRDLRGLLRRMVDSMLAGDAVEDRDLGALNGLLARAPLRRRLERDGRDWRVSLDQPEGDMDAVLGEVSASFSEMLASGLADRIKLCENRDCGWVMLDTTRNRSRRWCDPAECGNVMKVRRYRARHAALKKPAKKKPGTKHRNG